MVHVVGNVRWHRQWRDDDAHHVSVDKPHVEQVDKPDEHGHDDCHDDAHHEPKHDAIYQPHLDPHVVADDHANDLAHDLDDNHHHADHLTYDDHLRHDDADHHRLCGRFRLRGGDPQLHCRAEQVRPLYHAPACMLPLCTVTVHVRHAACSLLASAGQNQCFG